MSKIAIWFARIAGIEIEYWENRWTEERIKNNKLEIEMDSIKRQLKQFKKV